MKIDEIKSNKEDRLLETGFKLFTQKGIKKTSVQDITDEANIAKGTFYLYFKDKYELRDIIIAKKSEKLFNEAIQALKDNYIQNFSDQIIFIINYIIDILTKDQVLLKFISKNLSWGIYNKALSKIYSINSKNENSLYCMFVKGIKDNDIKLKNPDVTLYMIIELVSATCFNSIAYSEPLPIDEYKPYLYDTIRHLIAGE